MNILDFPDEILIIIVKNLNLQSLSHLFNVCQRFRSIIGYQGVIKKFILGKSPLATTQFFKRSLFKNLACCLETLDVSAVTDINKSSLLPVMKRLKHLKTLDVSFTNIIIPDLVKIYCLCPSIKNVVINFVFGNTTKIPGKVLLECQEVFKSFENVEFVGSVINLLYSKLPLYILDKASCLKEVKLTAMQCVHIPYQNEDYDSMFRFKKLILTIINWNQGGSFTDSEILSILNFSKHEYAIIKEGSKSFSCQVCISPVFDKFFANVNKVELSTLKSQDFNKDIILMFWDKETTQFDEIFFSRFSEKVKSLFPSYHYIPSVLDVPVNRDGICNLFIKGSLQSALEDNEPLFKKKRVVPQTHNLDFDYLFKNITNIYLTINFYGIATINTLSKESNYLCNLRRLTLTGNCRYSLEFFKMLLKSCTKLETLNIECGIVSSASEYISKSIKLSNSLKNIRILEKVVNFEELIPAMASYGLLENIHIVDDSLKPAELSNAHVLVENCVNLYSIYIEAFMYDTAKTKFIRNLKKAKTTSKRPYVNVEINSGSLSKIYSHDPFIEVFSVSPIQRI